MSTSKIEKTLVEATKKALLEYEVVEKYMNLLGLLSVSFAAASSLSYAENSSMTGVVYFQGIAAVLLAVFTGALWCINYSVLATAEAMVEASKIEWCEKALRHLQKRLLKNGRIRLRDLNEVISLQRMHEQIASEKADADRIRAAASSILSRKPSN